MRVSDYIGFVASEGELFAAAAEQGELTVDIAPCPGWDMRELVRHLGLIHLWAAGNVACPKGDRLRVDDLPDLAGHWPELATSWPDDNDLISWYRQTNANLVRVLESAPADLDCFTFLPAPTPLTMWARRQASETAIHRFDAELSRGFASEFDAPFVADMLDELMCGFVPRRRSLDLEGPRVLIDVHAEDVDEHWYVTLGPERADTARTGDGADLTLVGTAAELYLLLWNRTPDSSVTMTGNTALMDLWHGNFRVRWS
jgi:uncharacterized protein (TIGR03083 family)